MCQVVIFFSQIVLNSCLQKMHLYMIARSLFRFWYSNRAHEKLMRVPKYSGLVILYWWDTSCFLFPSLVFFIRNK